MKTINQSNVSPFALVFSKNRAKPGKANCFFSLRCVKILERRHLPANGLFVQHQFFSRKPASEIPHVLNLDVVNTLTQAI